MAKDTAWPLEELLRSGSPWSLASSSESKRVLLEDRIELLRGGAAEAVSLVGGRLLVIPEVEVDPRGSPALGERERVAEDAEVREENEGGWKDGDVGLVAVVVEAEAAEDEEEAGGTIDLLRPRTSSSSSSLPLEEAASSSPSSIP